MQLWFLLFTFYFFLLFHRSSLPLSHHPLFLLSIQETALYFSTSLYLTHLPPSTLLSYSHLTVYLPPRPLCLSIRPSALAFGPSRFLFPIRFSGHLYYSRALHVLPNSPNSPASSALLPSILFFYLVFLILSVPESVSCLSTAPRVALFLAILSSLSVSSLPCFPTDSP